MQDIVAEHASKLQKKSLLFSGRSTQGSSLQKVEKSSLFALYHSLWSPFLESPENFLALSEFVLRPRIAIHKTPTRLFCKAGLFIHCKGNKNKIAANFVASGHFHLEKKNENHVTRDEPEKFRDFLLSLALCQLALTSPKCFPARSKGGMNKLFAVCRRFSSLCFQV